MPRIGDILRKRFGEEPKHDKPIMNDKIAEYAKSLKNKDKIYLSKKQVIEKYHNICKDQYENYSENINAEYLDLLAGYMTKEDSFLKESKLQINNPSFDKCIMLIGIIGSGKSFLIHNLSKVKNVKNPILGKFVNEMDLLESREIAFSYKNFKNLIIDDYGTNKDGLEARWMRQLSEIRHDRYQRLGFKTHYTTNKIPDQIEEIYGSRIRDRLKENCNIILFKNKESLRK